jgi:hypothetical protein
MRVAAKLAYTTSGRPTDENARMHPVAPDKTLFGESPRRIRNIDKPIAQRKEGTRRGRANAPSSNRLAGNS